MKRIVTFLLALLLCMSAMVSCKSEDEQPSEQPSEPSEDSTEETPEEEPEKEEEEQAREEPKKVYSTLTKEEMYAQFSAHTVELSDGTTLNYRLYLPEDYDAKKVYPLLVFLHGAGERGDDNEAQLLHMMQTMLNLKNSPLREAIIFAPQCPSGQQWVDTPWANGNYSTSKVKESNELAGVVEIVDQLWFDYSIDENRIYAMGLSMGGFGTWDLLMRHSDIFAAGVPICGGGDPTMADVLVDVPIYTFHGSADPTVPVVGTRAMAEALEEAGSTVFTYEELEGMEHGIWSTVAARPDVLRWLFAQSLDER